MKFEIGYYIETADGPKWHPIKGFTRSTDAEAEAEIDSLKSSTPTDFNGEARVGLYIKRGCVQWFRRFSCHA